VIYQDAYHARTVIEDALSWLKEDGFTRDDLEEVVSDAVDILYEDE
jgi:hypothetical protein